MQRPINRQAAATDTMQHNCFEDAWRSQGASRNRHFHLLKLVREVRQVHGPSLANLDNQKLAAAVQKDIMAEML